MKANGTMIKRCELFVALFKANTWKLNAIYENWYKAYFKSLELSFSILTNAPHEASWTAIGPLRYWTTASPVMLPAVAAWNVLPFFLLQWNLSWVKDKTDLSSSMAVFVRTIWSLVIPRYKALTGSWEGGVEPITILERRSHPPEMKSCFLIRKSNRF